MRYRSSFLLSAARRAAFAALSPSLYIALACKAYPILERSRRWPQVGFRHIKDNLYEARDPEQRLQFLGHARVSRYLWPTGIRHAFAEILKKYTDEFVFVEPGDVVIDVGANIGEFSLAVHRLGVTCLAIEPEPMTYLALANNIGGLPGASSYNIALSNSSGHTTLFVSNDDADSSLITPTSWTHTVDVKSMTLSEFLAEQNLERVDFLKVEAEGAEPEILEGGGDVLSQIRKIAVDCGPERLGQRTDKEVSKILEHSGFAVRTKGDVVLAHR